MAFWDQGLCLECGGEEEMEEEVVEFCPSCHHQTVFGAKAILLILGLGEEEEL